MRHLSRPCDKCPFRVFKMYEIELCYLRMQHCCVCILSASRYEMSFGNFCCNITHSTVTRFCLFLVVGERDYGLAN